MSDLGDSYRQMREDKKAKNASLVEDAKDFMLFFIGYADLEFTELQSTHFRIFDHKKENVLDIFPVSKTYHSLKKNGLKNRETKFQNYKDLEQFLHFYFNKPI